MAKVEDCPGFETFGADVKAAREAKRLARKTLAEMVGIEWRYLANIENQGAIPSLPVMIQLIKVCGLPVERYFNPEIMREESEQRQRVSHKLKLCPEEYLPIIEGAIDGALKNGTDCEAEGGRIIAASFWHFYIKVPGTFPKVPDTSAGFLRFLSQSVHARFR